MTELNGHNQGSGAVADKLIADFIASLSEESKMLIALKSQLYGDSWTPMLDDLKSRLAGKPYIFKLVGRIQSDIERIEQMADFEAANNIDLADYVDIP